MDRMIHLGNLSLQKGHFFYCKVNSYGFYSVSLTLLEGMRACLRSFDSSKSSSRASLHLTHLSVLNMLERSRWATCVQPSQPHEWPIKPTASEYTRPPETRVLVYVEGTVSLSKETPAGLLPTQHSSCASTAGSTKHHRLRIWSLKLLRPSDTSLYFLTCKRTNQPTEVIKIRFLNPVSAWCLYSQQTRDRMRPTPTETSAIIVLLSTHTRVNQ